MGSDVSKTPQTAAPVPTLRAGSRHQHSKQVLGAAICKGWLSVCFCPQGAGRTAAALLGAAKTVEPALPTLIAFQEHGEPAIKVTTGNETETGESVARNQRNR